MLLLALSIVEFQSMRGSGGAPTGNVALGAVSSRFAAPSLRYGPSGDTPRRAAYGITMAVSKLPAMDGARNPDVRADMTFFETPGGGTASSLDSIPWGANLPNHGYYDNVVRISQNVIRRFFEDATFPMPDG